MIMKRTAGTTLNEKTKSTTDNGNRDGVHHLNQEVNKFRLYSTTNFSIVTTSFCM